MSGQSIGAAQTGCEYNDSNFSKGHKIIQKTVNKVA